MQVCLGKGRRGQQGCYTIPDPTNLLASDYIILVKLNTVIFDMDAYFCQLIVSPIMSPFQTKTSGKVEGEGHK